MTHPNISQEAPEYANMVMQHEFECAQQNAGRPVSTTDLVDQLKEVLTHWDKGNHTQSVDGLECGDNLRIRVVEDHAGILDIELLETRDSVNSTIGHLRVDTMDDDEPEVLSSDPNQALNSNLKRAVYSLPRYLISARQKDKAA